MRYFFLFLFLFITTAAHAETVRLERLNRIFEGNAAGMAYLQNCAQGGTAAQPVYMGNMRATTVALADEMLKMGGVTPAQVQEALSKRQGEMLVALGDFYQGQGCKTPQAQSAKQHFETFGQITPADMKVFLDTIQDQ